MLDPLQGMQLIQLFIKLASDICLDRLVQSHANLPGAPEVRLISVEDLPDEDSAPAHSRRPSMAVSQVR